MIHNDVLRRLRYALKLNDQRMLALFKLVEHELNLTQLYGIMQKEGEKGFVLCSDLQMCAFLDGLIVFHRGKQDGKLPQASSKRVSNNEILRKLRIALELKAEDMIAIMALADFRLSKSELSAFFRKPDHRNYKQCGNQVLRNFVAGLTIRNRGSAAKDQ